jgi:hypothetical protein
MQDSHRRAWSKDNGINYTRDMAESQQNNPPHLRMRPHDKRCMNDIIATARCFKSRSTSQVLYYRTLIIL